MKWSTNKRSFLAAAFVASLSPLGCADSSSTAVLSGASESPGQGVTQGGAQDIAEFRKEIDQRRVPGPELLDEVGFFAEHVLTQAAADCGEVVCVHPSLAVAPRFDGSSWTMAFVSLNTSLAPGTAPRPPVHVVAVVEYSPATEALLSSLGTALDRLGGALRTGDQVSVVVAGARPTVTLALQTVSSGPTGGIHSSLSVGAHLAGPVDLYAGLVAGYELAEGTPDHQGRLLLLTSGRADAGITDADRILALAAGHAELGTALSVIGMTSEFRADLPRRLGELGSGTYAYAEDEKDLGNVIAGEAAVNLVPLATRFSLRLEPAPGYRVGRVYGARSATVDGSAAVLASPALFVAERESAFDTDLGRRGGGGGLFVELIANGGDTVGPGAPAFTVRSTYDDVAAARSVELVSEVTNPLAPGQIPDRLWPEFSDPEHPKAFMMLNMYLALRATTMLYDQGDCGRARGIVEMMGPTVELWQAEFQDPDIAADSQLLQQLGFNIKDSCSVAPAPDPNFDGGCFGI